MSWSYQDTMPRDIDKVRFYLGDDTDSSYPLLTDEDIEFALSEAGTPKAAAALCCDRLATQYSRLADMSVGGRRAGPAGGRSLKTEERREASESRDRARDETAPGIKLESLILAQNERWRRA